MSMIAFLRKIVGQSPEGDTAQKRFESNIISVTEQERELDKLQEDMEQVVARVIETQRKIVASSHTSGFSGEHALHLSLPPDGETDDYERGDEEDTYGMSARENG